MPDVVDVRASAEDVVGVTLGVDTQDGSVRHEDCLENTSSDNSDFHDSSVLYLHQPETLESSHVDDVGTRDLGTSNADSWYSEFDFLYHTLEKESENLLVGRRVSGSPLVGTYNYMGNGSV